MKNKIFWTALLLPLLWLAGWSPAFGGSISGSEIIALSNQERARAGLPALKEVGALNSSAKMKLEDMVAKGYWGHIAPDGSNFTVFLAAAGYKYSYAGENLAKGCSTSSCVVSAWMASSGHKANIVSANHTETGVAVLEITVNGQQTYGIVAHYAAPVGSKAAPATVAAKPTVSAKAIPAPPIEPLTAPQAELAPEPAPEPVAVAEEGAGAETAGHMLPPEFTEERVLVGGIRAWALSALVMLILAAAVLLPKYVRHSRLATG